MSAASLLPSCTTLFCTCSRHFPSSRRYRLCAALFPLGNSFRLHQQQTCGALCLRTCFPLIATQRLPSRTLRLAASAATPASLKRGALLCFPIYSLPAWLSHLSVLLENSLFASHSACITLYIFPLSCPALNACNQCALRHISDCSAYFNRLRAHPRYPLRGST